MRPKPCFLPKDIKPDLDRANKAEARWRKEIQRAILIEEGYRKIRNNEFKPRTAVSLPLNQVEMEEAYGSIGYRLPNKVIPVDEGFPEGED